MIPDNIPMQVLNRLIPDEKILASATQSRIKNLGTQSLIVATNKRLIILESFLGGLSDKFLDFHYHDIEKIVHKTGKVFSEIRIETRYKRHLIFQYLEKSDAHNLLDVTQEMRLKSGELDTTSTKREAA